MFSLWSVFSLHLIKNRGKCLSPDLPENNDSPFIFVVMGPDPFSYRVSLEGMLNSKVLLSLLASSFGHFPWEKIPQSRAIHFQRQHYTISDVLYYPSCYYSSPFILIQNLWALLKSRWLFPRFLNDPQPPLPAPWTESGRGTKQTCGDIESNPVTTPNKAGPLLSGRNQKSSFSSSLSYCAMFLLFFLCNSDAKVVGDLALFLVRHPSVEISGNVVAFQGTRWLPGPTSSDVSQPRTEWEVVSCKCMGTFRCVWAADTLWGKLDYNTEGLAKL